MIARLVHADVIINVAKDRGDAEEANKAAQEADAVKLLNPDNPVALRLAVEARTVAIYAYKSAGQQGPCETAITLARSDAEALKRFPQYPNGLFARWNFLRSVGEQDSLLSELENSLPATEQYVMARFRRRELTRQALDKEKNIGPMYYCLILCDFPEDHERILDRYRKEAANPAAFPWEHVTNQMALLLLGQLDESRAACVAYRKKGLISATKDAEMQRALEYLSGSLSAEAYLRAAGASRVDQTNVHSFVGLKCLAEGKRKAAREHFHKAVQTGGFGYDHYELSWALLGRMEQDQGWPHWIPIVKE